jgi:hypothetical protein
MINAINKVLHNGRTYEHGEEILDLTKLQAERLIKLGSAEEEGATQYEQESGTHLPQIDDYETPEEFAGLKAEEQKELLETLEIEPASKAEDRVTQYTEWYNIKVSGDEL